jgi:hypothetical protein
MYSSTLPSTSALDGVGGQRHVPVALPPGKTRCPLYRMLVGPQGRSGRVRKILPPPGLFFLKKKSAFIYIIHSLLWYKKHFCTPVSLCICLLQSEKAYNLHELETSVFISNLTSSVHVFLSISRCLHQVAKCNHRNHSNTQAIQ